MIALQIELAGLPEHLAAQQVHTFIRGGRLGGCYLQCENKKEQQANDGNGQRMESFLLPANDNAFMIDQVLAGLV